jgi:uncharacterized protein YndB with AHSA1/START domain
MELITALDAVRREIVDTTHDGEPARAIVAERTYPAPVDDVWDALTSPERIPRWFLPVSGELHLGGRYQLEGNAGGTIVGCQPPHHLALTWEFGGGVSWVDVRLTASGDATTLRLEHVALVADSEQWGEFGPGAVGVGWDLTLLGLAEHLATGAAVHVDETSPEVLDLMRRSSTAWGEAAVASGTPRDVAEAAAARTTAFYTGA